MEEKCVPFLEARLLYMLYQTTLRTLWSNCYCETIFLSRPRRAQCIPRHSLMNAKAAELKTLCILSEIFYSIWVCKQLVQCQSPQMKRNKYSMWTELQIPTILVSKEKHTNFRTVSCHRIMWVMDSKHRWPLSVLNKFLQSLHIWERALIDDAGTFCFGGCPPFVLALWPILVIWRHTGQSSGSTCASHSLL